MLERGPEEGGNIVPILPYSLLRHAVVDFPEFLYLIGKDVELLVVGILLNGSLPLQAVDDQLQTYLRVFHAHPHICLKKLRIAFFPQLLPFPVESFHILIDLAVSKVDEVAVGRIKKPILCCIVGFECNEAHPMVGNSQHEIDYQWFFLLVISEVGYVFIQLPLLVLGEQQILVLELPSKGEQFEVAMIPEDFEFFKIVEAEFVVGSFEIAIEDV